MMVQSKDSNMENMMSQIISKGYSNTIKFEEHPHENRRMMKREFIVKFEHVQ
jgi:hypothetical protein